ncbi:MAG: peptidoglycan bridge formation glycyltransferase FemA/FemB family protein [Bacteroidetes bacterium]|nr:peptidoglycan bridge formation glycyltransferase FemA/FemB family protein [Bacteroidota bacterium]
MNGNGALKPEEAEQLNSFLLGSGNNLLYSSPCYLSLLQNYLSPVRMEVLRHFSNGKLAGYFPFVIRLNEKYGNVCNSLPYYGSNGGIITHSQLSVEEKNEVRASLLSLAEKKMKEYDCVSSTIITNPLDADTGNWIRDHFKHDLVDERIGQLTPLPLKGDEAEERLLKLFEDPRPRNIRRAQKENITVRFSNDPADLDFLFEVHQQNITAIGGIAKEKRFFDLIPSHFSEKDFRIYVAELNGEKIAALLLFYFNETVEYFTPAVVEAFRQLQPSALLIYRAMLDAMNENFHWWNWGGTWLSQGGVYDFKKKWGTKDHPYFYYTRISDENILKHSKEELIREYPFFFVAPFGQLKPVV